MDLCITEENVSVMNYFRTSCKNTLTVKRQALECLNRRLVTYSCNFDLQHSPTCVFSVSF